MGRDACWLRNSCIIWGGKEKDTALASERLRLLSFDISVKRISVKGRLIGGNERE